MNNPTAHDTREWMGMPLKLIWGYIAIALFMTGDGFELAFLSKYIVDLGFTEAQSSNAFAVYGFAAAIAAWVSGVVAEIITPRKAMIIGFVMWAVLHVLLLIFGLGQSNYAMILLFYGLRGLAYPLFLYSFIVMIVQNVEARQIGPSMGWFWTVYSFGIGVFGSFIPSFTIPIFGEMGTLWSALIFVVLGGLVAVFKLGHLTGKAKGDGLSTQEKLSELSRAITLLKNPQIAYASFIRIVNTLSLFGYAVIGPMYFTKNFEFSTSQWLQIWTVFFATTLVSNVFWGIVGEKIGWVRTIRWFGCIGMALSTLVFYYLPEWYNTVAPTGLTDADGSAAAGMAEFMMAWIPAILLGWFVAAFVPMTPIFTTLEPTHKGAAISVYTLSAGLSNFAAPAIAGAVLAMSSQNYEMVALVFTACYIVAFGVSFLLKVNQPKH